MFCERHDKAPLNKHTNRRHATCEYTRSASHIFSLFRRFGRFLTKPNTQDCVRCRGMGSLAAPFGRIPGGSARARFSLLRNAEASSSGGDGRREACRVKDQVRATDASSVSKTCKMITKPSRRCQIPGGGSVLAQFVIITCTRIQIIRIFPAYLLGTRSI